MSPDHLAVLQEMRDVIFYGPAVDRERRLAALDAAIAAAEREAVEIVHKPNPLCECGHPWGLHAPTLGGTECHHETRTISRRGVAGLPITIRCECVLYVPATLTTEEKP